MKELNDRTCANNVARAARLKVLLLLPLLAVLACALAPYTATAQESTADVCRETKKVYAQLDREFDELYIILSFKREEDWWWSKLSELRRAIAGGYVVSKLDDIVSALRRADPDNADLSKPGSSTEKRLAFQRLAKGLVESGLQKAQKDTLADLEAQKERLIKQMNIREQRMRDLNCNEVLAREKSSSNDAGEKKSSNGCVGFAGKWLTSIDNVVMILNSGGSGTYFWRGQNNTIGGSVSGNVLEGEYQQTWHPTDNLKSGRIKFTLSADGNSFAGQWWYKDGKYGGSWNGTCQSDN